MKKLLETVAYLHKNKITHLDIKPENILFPTPHDPNQIKLTDFGLSKYTDCYQIRGLTGSFGYMAPEMFTHGVYTRKADIFSCGMVLYVMLTGENPIIGFNDVIMRQRTIENVLSFSVTGETYLSFPAVDMI